MHSRNVEIKSPCHESWDAMHGDAERRFCDVCAKHVHNLSAMTRQAATDLLQAHKGEHLCVRYSNQEDGQIAFRDTVPLSRLRPVRTAFAALLLAACAPHGDGPPIQDIGDIAIEAMARDAKPSPEGGCEVQTGPFTTMHFPAGHEVCKNVVDLGAQIRPPQPPPIPTTPEVTVPTMGAAPIAADPPPPPPTEELMGKVAPVEHAKMGEAMPEVKEPCDPQPGFAPPPPQQMGQAPVKVVEPPKSEPLMGDIAVDIPPPPPPEPVRMGRIAPAKTGTAKVVGDR